MDSCPYCGVAPIEINNLIVPCDCAESRNEALIRKEQNKQLNRQREVAKQKERLAKRLARRKRVN